MDVVITRDTLPAEGWSVHRKKVLTQMRRMEGPFTVVTKEGGLSCEDGYLAVDSAGWPYPVAASDYDAMYEPAP